MTTKEAYFKLIELSHQIPEEYIEALEIALNALQKEINAIRRKGN